MANIEGFDDSHFMDQTVRVGHTQHPDSIVSSMACIVDLKNKLYITGKSYCYSLGMAKIESFDDSHFMHQTVRVRHTDHPDSMVSSMACIVDLKNKIPYNRKITLL